MYYVLINEKNRCLINNKNNQHYLVFLIMMSWRDRNCYSSLWNIMLMVRLFWLMHKINKRDDHISVLFKRLSSQSKQTTIIFITRMLLKGILSTKIVIFSYPKLLSFSVLTFIKWRLTPSYAAKDTIFWQ